MSDGRLVLRAAAARVKVEPTEHMPNLGGGGGVVNPFTTGWYLP